VLGESNAQAVTCTACNVPCVTCPASSRPSQPGSGRQLVRRAPGPLHCPWRSTMSGRALHERGIRCDRPQSAFRRSRCRGRAWRRTDLPGSRCGRWPMYPTVQKRLAKPDGRPWRSRARNCTPSCSGSAVSARNTPSSSSLLGLTPLDSQQSRARGRSSGRLCSSTRSSGCKLSRFTTRILQARAEIMGTGTADAIYPASSGRGSRLRQPAAQSTRLDFPRPSDYLRCRHSWCGRRARPTGAARRWVVGGGGRGRSRRGSVIEERRPRKRNPGG
jgi:hypothetical protein